MCEFVIFTGKPQKCGTTNLRTPRTKHVPRYFPVTSDREQLWRGVEADRSPFGVTPSLEWLQDGDETRPGRVSRGRVGFKERVAGQGVEDGGY